ncbi:MAG TPA: hypothetical protein V6D29_09885 [Leptolyngbyaceae cyanobacterium]
MTTILPTVTQPVQTTPVESCKATLFKIADHWFALPTTAILKVFPSSILNGQPKSDLLIWDNRPLVQLNLHKILARKSIGHSSGQDAAFLKDQPYTMLVWSQTGERCSIPVEELPVIQNLALSDAQVLPPHYRQSIYNIAKYMVIHPYKGTAANVLLLDLQQALNKLSTL